MSRIAVLFALLSLTQMGISLLGNRLSPDRMGGFGLFSTVDKLPLRRIKLYGRSQFAEEFRHFPIGKLENSDLKERCYLESLASFPSDWRMRKFLKAVARDPSLVGEEYTELRLVVSKPILHAEGARVSYREVAALSYRSAEGKDAR